MPEQDLASALLRAAPQIPLWIKLLYTLYVCAVVGVYSISYPPANFLWFSDIALLITVAALWLENALLASMMLLAIGLPELGWNIGFFGRLILRRDVTGLAGYMFDAHKPLYVRALSLFHVFLPALLVWLVYRLGYDRRAWIAQTLLAWLILPSTYALTRPADNINWVFGPGSKPQTRLPPLAYLVLVMVFFPLVIYLPTHFLLLKSFGKSALPRPA